MGVMARADDASSDAVTSIDNAAWTEEFKLHDAHFDQLAYHLPQALLETKARLEKRLAAA